MIKMTYVVSVLVVLRLADGERQMAMAVDVGAGRGSKEGPMGLDWRRLAVDGDQARRRRAMAASVEERQMDWLVVDLEVRRSASIEEQARQRRTMPARV